MRVRTTSVSRYSVLVLGGEVTAHDADELRRELGSMLSEDSREMVICDLSRVRSADPDALTVFASHHGTGEGPGPAICLAGARGAVALTLEQMGIPRFVVVAPTVAAAVELARARPPRLCAVRSLAGGPSAPRLARRFARDTCVQWDLDGVADDVELLVAELVTNAVDHAGTDVVLRLERTTDQVTVAVRDGKGGHFASWWRGEPDGDDDPDEALDVPVWGHGLTIVRALAMSAGVQSDAAGGKVVWAVLPARPAADGAGPNRPVRWRLTVNSGRGGVHENSRWVVRLGLAWLPDRPDQVWLSLSYRPNHPSLPRGRWRVARSAMHDGLLGPVQHGGLRLWPDSSGRQLVLELPGDPPKVLRVSAAQVRQFLVATGVAGPD
jgi:anti-anti-sigma regulatory factor/anti-sigma regulatory factor (Ser/Thr protein kinase)